MADKIYIGQVEDVRLPEVEQSVFLARIDTGARTSAIWASLVTKHGDKLEVVFFGKRSPLYTGKPLIFKEYGRVSVTSSTGITERRYKVRLLVEIGGRRIRAWFTLANRSRQVYPVLIGRNVLKGKFVVDISHSKSLPSGKKAGVR
jgi:hypothetical protein